MQEQYPKSPVPSDADLRTGELPFTAFGQFGHDMLDKRVFEQDLYWVDRYGTPHRLEEMSDQYRRAVISFLLESAAHFHFGQVLRAELGKLIDALDGTPNGDALGEAVGMLPVRAMEPQQWLESTPLMRRLRLLTTP